MYFFFTYVCLFVCLVCFVFSPSPLFSVYDYCAPSCPYFLRPFSARASRQAPRSKTDWITGVRLCIFACEYPKHARPTSLPLIRRCASPRRPRLASPRLVPRPPPPPPPPSPPAPLTPYFICLFVSFLFVVFVCRVCFSGSLFLVCLFVRLFVRSFVFFFCVFRVNDALIALEHGTHLTSLIRACIALGE